MTRVYDVAQVRARLTERIVRDGYRPTATAFGVTESYLRQVLRSTKTPGPAILAGLGMQKVYTDKSASPLPHGRAK